MSLEDIVTIMQNVMHDVKNFAVVLFETAVNHPVLTAAATTLLTTAELSRTKTSEENIFCYAIMAGIAAHAACSAIKNSVYQPPLQSKHSFEGHRKGATKSLLSQQPSLTALATASIAAIVTFPDNPATSETTTSMFLANYALIHSLISSVNAQNELKQFYCPNKKIQTEQNSAGHHKAATTLDYFLEKSSILSAAVGGMTFAYFAQKFGYGYEHYSAPTFVLNTLLAAAAATITSFTSLFLTGILHSSTRKYCKLSLKASAQKFIGNYDAALKTITELEKIASPNTTAQIELQKAELTIRKGEYGKGLIMLRDAIATPHSTTRNPLEIISDATGITTMTTLLQLFMAASYDPAKFFEHGLVSYKHGKNATASMLISMGTHHEAADLDNKLLSVDFHTTIGDQHEADREFRNIICYSRPEKFQTIAFSSDEFCIHPSSELMCTIGIKCSKNGLTYENMMTRVFNNSATHKKQRAQILAHARKVKHLRHKDGLRDYLCMAYATGIPLSRIEGKETVLFDALALVLEADAQAQEYADTNHIREIKQLDYFSVFKKFIQRITKNKDKQKILYTAGAFIPTYLSHGERSVIHYNPHAGNIIQQPDRTLCLIDFGDVCRGEVGLDVEDVTTSLAPNTSRQQVYEHGARISNKPLTKTQLRKNSYASVFKTATLLGRSIAYNEGSQTEANENLARVIKEIMTFVPEKLLFQRFLDTLTPLTEHLSQEQYANSKQTNTSQQ